MKFFLTIAAIMAVAVAHDVPAAKEPTLPNHKPGLWQNDGVSDGHHSINQACLDNASETQMRALGRKRCSAHSITHNADGSWTTTSTCSYPPAPERTSRSHISGDFTSKVVVVTQASTGAPITITSTWIGPCKPGQKGGDVMMSNGTKINMLDVMSH